MGSLVLNRVLTIVDVKTNQDRLTECLRQNQSTAQLKIISCSKLSWTAANIFQFPIVQLKNRFNELSKLSKLRFPVLNFNRYLLRELNVCPVCNNIC